MIVHKSVFTPLQTNDSNMHVYAHSWSSDDTDRNQLNNQLLGLFLVQHSLVFLFISITFFTDKLFKRVKATIETTVPLAHFFYNTILY